MAKVADLHEQGYSVRIIASKIKGIEKSTVHDYLKELEAEYLEEAKNTYALHRARLIRESRRVKVHAWKMFNKTCKNYKQETESVKTDKGETAQGDIDKETKSHSVKKIIMFGEPRYLDIVKACIKEEAELLGIYHWVKKEALEDGGGGGVAEVILNQQAYIHGLGVVNPELFTPEMWEILHDQLPNQDAKHYDH